MKFLICILSLALSLSSFAQTEKKCSSLSDPTIKKVAYGQEKIEEAFKSLLWPRIKFVKLHHGSATRCVTPLGACIIISLGRAEEPLPNEGSIDPNDIGFGQIVSVDSAARVIIIRFDQPTAVNQDEFPLPGDWEFTAQLSADTGVTAIESGNYQVNFNSQNPYGYVVLNFR